MNSRQKAEAIIKGLKTLEDKELNTVEMAVKIEKQKREKASKDSNGNFTSTETL